MVVICKPQYKTRDNNEGCRFVGNARDIFEALSLISKDMGWTITPAGAISAIQQLYPQYDEETNSLIVHVGACGTYYQIMDNTQSKPAWLK